MSEDETTVVLEQRRNTGPDAKRDHQAVHEQLTKRRDEAARNVEKEARRRDEAERGQARWEDERDRYDVLLRAIGVPS